MLTENGLLPFARKCAKAYVASRGARDFDDAVSEACVYLLSHREKWDSPAPVLKKRVVCELIRSYQREHGLRLKNPPNRVDLTWEIEGRVENEDLLEQQMKLDRAMNQPGVKKNREVVEALRSGKKKTEVAREFGLKRGEVAAIFNEYARAVTQLGEGGGVQIVDGRDAGPLFSLRP